MSQYFPISAISLWQRHSQSLLVTKESAQRVNLVPFAELGVGFSWSTSSEQQVAGDHRCGVGSCRTCWASLWVQQPESQPDSRELFLPSVGSGTLKPVDGAEL